MVELKTELSPFRIVFGRTKSVELMVQVINDNEKARLVTCDVILSNQLSFEKQGMTNAKTLNLGEMAPAQKALYYFPIYPKMSIEKGEQPIVISVVEHFNNNPDYILSKKTKTIHLRVE